MSFFVKDFMTYIIPTLLMLNNIFSKQLNNETFALSSSNPSDDPNQPVAPSPGSDPNDYPTEIFSSPPSSEELEKVYHLGLSGANINGVVNAVGSSLTSELAARNIGMHTVRGIATSMGLNMVQAGAFAVNRAVQHSLNTRFAQNGGGGDFGGGNNGGNDYIHFYEPNMNDGASGPPGGGGGGGGRDGSIYHPALHSHLDANGKPGEVVLNIGIDNKFQVRYYKEYQANSYSPTHLTCAIFQLPDETVNNGLLSRFLQNSVYLRVVERLGRSFNNNLDVSLFSNANLRTYFNTVMLAMQYYYWYESLYAYAMNRVGTNDGLMYLRRNISASDVNDLMILRAMIASLPIPPNMNLLMNWLGQNWQCASLGDSPVIKICPFPIDNTGMPVVGTKIQDMITTLSTTSFRSMTAIMVKAFDEWYLKDLFPSSTILEHNADFTTLWSNLPCKVVSTTAPIINTKQPGGNTSDSVLSYQTFSDELDGAIMGMFTSWDVSSSQWMPGLFQPVTTVYSGYENNRFSWMGTTTKFGNIWTNPQITLARPETYQVTGTLVNGSVTLGPVNTVQSPFSQGLLGVTNNSCAESGYKLLQWLFNFDDYNAGLASSAGSISQKSPRGNAVNKSSGKGGFTRRKPNSSPQKANSMDEEL